MLQNQRTQIKYFLLLLIITQLVSCNDTSTSFSEKLEIAMSAAFSAPADARGTTDPKSLTFTLTGITLTLSDQTALNLYQDQDPKEFRIVARSQLILEADLSKYVSKEISEIAISFSKNIKGSGKYSSELTTSLSDATARYSVPFKIQTAKTVRLEIQTQWKNTISTDTTTDPPTETLSAPGMILDLKNSDST